MGYTTSSLSFIFVYTRLYTENITWFDLMSHEAGQDPDLIQDAYGQYLLAIYFATMTLTTVINRQNSTLALYDDS